MSTLIKNVGILDARKASPEQLREIGKVVNVGCLVIHPGLKAELLKINLQDVGKMLELDDDYRLHTGPLEISRQMLEDTQDSLKLCVVGPLSLEPDITVELLQEKLSGLCLIGPASVPEHLYGTFMSVARDIVGPVSPLKYAGLRAAGKILITDTYLNGLEDGAELTVAGNVTFAEEVDAELFARKISKLQVVGAIKCLDTQEEMLHKVLTANSVAKIKIIRVDFHYVPGGTMLDTFTIMTVNKQTVSCPGLLILDEEVTPELIKEKDIHFEAGTLYFPKSVMREMSSRLAPKTKGIPFEPGKLELVASQQCMTQVRLETMPDKVTLVVSGELTIGEEVSIEQLSAKIGVLDNYGEIIASRDQASILQSKLRHDEGSVVISGEEDDDEDHAKYDNVIENLATYVL